MSRTSPPEQLIDRHAERLALDIPERDVDGRERGATAPSDGEEAAAGQGLPEMLDAEGILPDQQWLEMLDRASDGQLAPGQAGLADAGDAFIGIDDDERGNSETHPKRDSR